MRKRGEGDDRGWDGWMASLTWWTWVWVNSGSWWWTGRPGVLWFMGSQRVGHDWATDLIWWEKVTKTFLCIYIFLRFAIFSSWHISFFFFLTCLWWFRYFVCHHKQITFPFYFLIKERYFLKMFYYIQPLYQVLLFLTVFLWVFLGLLCKQIIFTQWIFRLLL